MTTESEKRYQVTYNVGDRKVTYGADTVEEIEQIVHRMTKKHVEQAAQPPIAVPRCAPEDGAADNSWHWIEVPGPTGRRTGCFEWMGAHWWPNGRQVTPEFAATSGWRYVRAATEQPAPEAEPEKPARCVPPNLPLQTSMHLLQIGGRQIKARWHGIAETWLIAEGFGDGALTPEEVAAKGFTYVAALPGEPSANGKHALLAPGGLGRTLAPSGWEDEDGFHYGKRDEL